jgi:hypothetical protein
VPHRPFAAYLRDALGAPYDTRHNRYQRLATVVVEQALAGDMAAIRLLIERLDGAVAPNVEATVTQETLVILHEVLPRLMRRGKPVEEIARSVGVLKAAAGLSAPDAPETLAPGDEGHEVLPTNGTPHPNGALTTGAAGSAKGALR